MNVILIILMLLMPFPLYVAFQSLFKKQRHNKYPEGKSEHDTM